MIADGTCEGRSSKSGPMNPCMEFYQHRHPDKQELIGYTWCHSTRDSVAEKNNTNRVTVSKRLRHCYHVRMSLNRKR